MPVHATTTVVSRCVVGEAMETPHEVHSSWNANYGFDRSFARSFSAEKHGLLGHKLKPSHKSVKRRNNGHDHQSPKEAHDQPQAKETHSELQATAPCQSDELQSKHDWLRQQLGKAQEE